MRNKDLEKLEYLDEEDFDEGIKEYNRQTRQVYKSYVKHGYTKRAAFIRAVKFLK